MTSERALQLGPVTLRNPYLLAPMESVTDSAYRRLCWGLGAGCTFTEMIRGAAFARENKATLDLVDTHDADVLTGVQFLTKGPEELKATLETFFKLRETAPYAHFKNVRLIELNFSCPSDDVIRVGLGASMLKRAQKVAETFKTLKETVRAHDTAIAVGAKLRLGLNQAEKRAGVAERLLPAANEHLDYLVVHARHAGQESTEPADWTALAAIRQKITVPFIGNGDVFTAEDAKRMIATTGVDGVQVSRGAIRNPWLFRALAGTGSETPTRTEIETARRTYLELATKRGTKEKFLKYNDGSFERILRK